MTNDKILDASYEYVMISFTCLFVICILLTYTNSVLLFFVYLALHKVLLDSQLFSKIPRLVSNA